MNFLLLLLVLQMTQTQTVDKRSLQKLAEEARQIAIETSCGSCHGDSTHKGDPEALAVFDLRDRRWFRRLDAAQLDGGLKRIRSKVDAKKLSRWTEFVKIAKRALEYAER